jgi:uncharacterized membrane protein YkvA (DUF1232 family)
MNNNKKGDDFVQGIKKIIGAFLILVSIFYVLSPIDVLPDFIPAIGYGDDFIIGMFGLLGINLVDDD